MRRALTRLDEGELVYCTASKGFFQEGQAPPGYPNLRIHEIEERVDAGDVIATLTCRGLVNGASKIIARNRRQGAFAFDVCDVKIITATPNSFNPGSTLAGSGSMFLIEKGREDLLDGRWHQLDLTYQGIESTKLRQRVITVDEEIVSPTDPISVQLPGGWTTPQKGQVSLPTVVVTDTFVTRIYPPTNAIPGNAVPPNAPSVNVFNVQGADLTRHWPNKWKYSGINSTELFDGAGVFLTSLSYKFQWEYTF